MTLVLSKIRTYKSLVVLYLLMLYTVLVASVLYYTLLYRALVTVIYYALIYCQYSDNNTSKYVVHIM
jgi:hypothetical protein